MRIALADLKLETLFVVHPGRRSLPLDDKIQSVGLAVLPELLRRL